MPITGDPLSLFSVRLSRALLPALTCFGLLAGSAFAQPDIPAGVPAAAAAPQQLTSYNEVVVKRGDTAYNLAREYGLTVPQLLDLNGLASHDLEVGQTLKVAVIPPRQVVKGDTLYSLARNNGLTVEALQAANGLSDTNIEIGQWLAIPAAPQARPMPAEVLAESPAFSVTAPAASTLADSASESLGWRRNAMAMLNTPYVYGGNSATGVDCSSFVVRVFQPLGLTLPRTSAQQARVGKAVPRSSLHGGDLVFFDTVGRGSVTHVGIYLGNDQFVNANSYYGRVVIDKLEADRYWAPRYLSARRVLDSSTVAQLSSGQTLALRPGGAD
ncbi:C40 family peptidase [Deinococcus sp. Marseille-Q6407]|uniref:C40 family peptidase n=1 Tax=Deinococcus sp. Marseille-Q6407 TaxID=2969223 RepID=UPI0021BE8C15|nr:C40 family peptidase [Deinococcus sp. Marseille-Q6407]